VGVKKMKSAMEKWSSYREKLQTASQEFQNAVFAIEPALREKSGTFGAWSLKDVVAHIIGWEIEAAQRFRLFLEGPAGDVKYNINKFNEHSVDSQKHLTWDQVMDNFHRAQRELQFACELVGEDILAREKRFFQWLLTLTRHYQHHTKIIEQYKRNE
jgi:hypothetical protein